MPPPAAETASNCSGALWAPVLPGIHEIPAVREAQARYRAASTSEQSRRWWSRPAKDGTQLDGKSMHQHTACSPIARERADFGLRLNEGCRMSNGIEEFPTQSATLLFVPAGRRRQTLPPCCFEISQCPGHCPRMSRAIRCFTLSHDSSFSVPASSASTRRLISLSQEMAASGSAGPSRLASNSADVLHVPQDLPVSSWIPGIPAKLVQPYRLPAGINVRLPRKFIPFVSPEPSEPRLSRTWRLVYAEGVKCS